MIKTFKDGLTWLVDFISKPLAGWAIAISLGVFLFVNSNSRYKEGVIDGGKSSIVQIRSLTSTVKDTQVENINLKNSVTNYQKLYDDCIKKSNNVDIIEEVQKALEKSDRLERILDRKIINTEKQTNDFNTLIPKK